MEVIRHAAGFRAVGGGLRWSRIGERWCADEVTRLIGGAISDNGGIYDKCIRRLADLPFGGFRQCTGEDSDTALRYVPNDRMALVAKNALSIQGDDLSELQSNEAMNHTVAPFVLRC